MGKGDTRQNPSERRARRRAAVIVSRRLEFTLQTFQRHPFEALRLSRLEGVNETTRFRVAQEEEEANGNQTVRAAST